MDQMATALAKRLTRAGGAGAVRYRAPLLAGGPGPVGLPYYSEQARPFSDRAYVRVGAALARSAGAEGGSMRFTIARFRGGCREGAGGVAHPRAASSGRRSDRLR